MNSQCHGDKLICFAYEPHLLTTGLPMYSAVTMSSDGAQRKRKVRVMVNVKDA